GGGRVGGRSRRAIVPRTPFHIISTREGSAGGAMTSGESMSPTFRPVLLLASAVVCVGLSGCGASGPNLHPVEGTVSVKGKPAAGAIVFFHHQDRSSPKHPVPYGKADRGGRFQPTPGVAGEGARGGWYGGPVVWPAPNAKPDKDGSRPALLKGAYSDPKVSKLVVEVTAGKNALPPFNLE